MTFLWLNGSMVAGYFKAKHDTRLLFELVNKYHVREVVFYLDRKRKAIANPHYGESTPEPVVENNLIYIADYEVLHFGMGRLHLMPNG